MNNWHLFRVESKIEKKKIFRTECSVFFRLLQMLKMRATVAAQILTVARQKVLVCSLRCGTRALSYMHREPKLTKLSPQK